MTEEVPFLEHRFQPLDFQKRPEPPRWLVDGLIAVGDVTMLEAEEGSYKSFLTMALAVAVCEGWGKFLGRELKHHGTVLYVDEENPEDVVYTRLGKLGLTEQGQQNLKYLWFEDILLDERPEEFFWYARDLKPVLVVLDSLTRLHNLDENNAGQMAGLFNKGIQPLARKLDAAVVLIHHQNKSGGVRGSTDIKAAIDSRLTVGPETNGSFPIFQNKSRRRKTTGQGLRVTVEDRPDGSVALVADQPMEPNF